MMAGPPVENAKFRSPPMFVSRERLQSGAQPENTTHAGGQIFIEIVDPVAGIDPALRTPSRDTRISKGATLRLRVAERNHRFGEADPHLAHLLDGPAGRERFNSRLLLCGQLRKDCQS